jgi:hypothetical protein
MAVWNRWLRPGIEYAQIEETMSAVALDKIAIWILKQ